jgi:hypothetical protein
MVKEAGHFFVSEPMSKFLILKYSCLFYGFGLILQEIYLKEHFLKPLSAVIMKIINIKKHGLVFYAKKNTFADLLAGCRQIVCFRTTAGDEHSPGLIILYLQVNALD